MERAVVGLARVRSTLRATLSRMGLEERVGADGIPMRVRDAVVDHPRRAPPEHPAAAAGPDTAPTTDRTTPTGDAEARRDRDDPGMPASDDVRESGPRASPTRDATACCGATSRGGDGAVVPRVHMRHRGPRTL